MPQVEKYEAPRLGQVVTLNVGFMERLPINALLHACIHAVGLDAS